MKVNFRAVALCMRTVSSLGGPSASVPPALLEQTLCSCLAGVNGGGFCHRCSELPSPFSHELTGHFLQWKRLREADSFQTSCHLSLICDGWRKASKAAPALPVVGLIEGRDGQNPQCLRQVWISPFDTVSYSL